ncbi:MAG: hypothetical protein AB1716_21505, partial [Planctomycetota bacterium]
EREAQANRRAALEVLARHVRPEMAREALPVLERCGEDPALRDASLRLRGLLDDGRVAGDLAELWLRELERVFLLRGISAAGRLESEAGAKLALCRAEEERDRTADALRVLARDSAHGVLERLAESYWQTWSWLGQGAGDRYALDYLALVRPVHGRPEPNAAEGPGDALRRVAEQAAPLARAAAGLVIDQLGPQYRGLCRRIGTSLTELLPTCSAADQQRVAWAAARLLGRTFGAGPRATPLDVNEQDIAAAQAVGRPGSAAALQPAYPAPPLLTWRVTTADRQLEEELLANLQRGGRAADRAQQQWVEAQLGCTPRVRALLSSPAGATDAAAVTAALVIVAETNDVAARPELVALSAADGQPAAVRALAYMVLGSLDARRGRWESGWPAGLELGDPAALDTGTPGWDHLGRVLALGGRAALDRLSGFKPAPLAAEVRTKLLEAARRAGAQAGARPAR